MNKRLIKRAAGESLPGGYRRQTVEGFAHALARVATGKFLIAARLTPTLAALLGLIVALPTTASGQEPKERVAEILADMISRRDQLKTYAVVLFGTDGPAVGDRQPYAMVRVVNQAKQFDLQAHYRYTARYLEYGSERVTTADSYKWRKYPITNYYLVVPKTEQNKWHRPFFPPIGHDPFDAWINVMGVSTHNYMTIEQHLERHPLQDAKIVDGKLVARFMAPNDTSVWITTFDPANQYMPTRGEIRNKDDDQLYHAINLTWDKINGQLLPVSLDYLYKVGSRNRTVTTPYAKRFKLYWLLGDQIPQQVFTGPDHLLPLLDHLHLPHSKYDKQRDLWVAADLWTPLSLPVPDEFEEFK